jgi:polyphosphate glucokinase
MASLGTGIGTAFFTDGVLLPNTEFGHIILKNGEEAEVFASNATRKREDMSWEVWTDRLNQFIKYLDDLLWPDLYIIGGGVVKYHEEFMKMLKSKCAEIVPAQLLNHAGVIGSALSFIYAEDHIKKMHHEDSSL